MVITSVLATGNIVQMGWLSTVDLLLGVTLYERTNVKQATTCILRYCSALILFWVIRAVLATGNALQTGWLSTIDLLLKVTSYKYSRKIQIKCKTRYQSFFVCYCPPLVLFWVIRPVLATGIAVQKGWLSTFDLFIEVTTHKCSKKFKINYHNLFYALLLWCYCLGDLSCPCYRECSSNGMAWYSWSPFKSNLI